MAQTDRILKQFADQAAACDELGSPFTARLCRLLATRLDLGSRFGRTILEWSGNPHSDNIALRACGAVHALARSGWEPSLSKVYPPNAATDHQLWVALADALRHNDAFLTERLASAPQTNEVARSALILGAMLRLAEGTGLPLELYEIGASAGLNLGFDGYRYELGEGRHWGSENAPLTVECTWRGREPPLGTALSVVDRHGCDVYPVDPSSLEDRSRLLAYIWADQEYRLKRTAAALTLAASGSVRVDRADAADWLEANLALPQPRATTRVVFHTIVWPYLSAASRQRISALLDRIGSEASSDKPLAHLSIEPDDTPGSARIEMTTWPAGWTIVLGRGDFHGRWAEWH